MTRPTSAAPLAPRLAAISLLGALAIACDAGPVDPAPTGDARRGRTAAPAGPEVAGASAPAAPGTTPVPPAIAAPPAAPEGEAAPPAAADEPRADAPPPDWRDLAVGSPDPARRAEAIAALSLERDVAAARVLLAASRDPDPGVRARSVAALRLVAADLPEVGGDAEAALSAALDDPDPAVRRAAAPPSRAADAAGSATR
jgi:hypothetical protein